MAHAQIGAVFVANLSQKLNDAERFVKAEVRKFEETINTLKEENSRLLRSHENLGSENEQLKNKLQEMYEKNRVGGFKYNIERQNTSPKNGVERQTTAPKSNVEYKNASPKKISVRDARGESSPASPQREDTRSPKKKTGKEATDSEGSDQSGDDWDAEAARIQKQKQMKKNTGFLCKKPVFSIVTPESVQLIVSRLKAAAYKAGGSKIDESFFRRLDKDNSGEMDCQEFLQSLRKELKVSPKEVSDEQARHIFRELDMDGSDALAIDELALLVTVATSEKGFVKEIEANAPKEDMPPSILHRLVSRLKNCASKEGSNTIDEKFFKKLDKDNSGRLDFKEFTESVRKLLRLSPMEISDEQLKRIYRNIDTDHSGFIEVGDLISLVRAVPPDSEKPAPGKADCIKPDRDMPPEMIKKFIERLKQKAFKNGKMKINNDWFKSLDRSGNGKLDKEEWIDAIRVNMGLTTRDMNDACAKKLFHMLDADNSGQLDIEEIGELAKDIHPSENPQLANMVQETKRVQNVCRLLARSQQLTYNWEGAFFEAEYQVGSRVRIMGLTFRTDLNGEEGTVIDFDEQSWRYKVCLDNAQRLCFGPKNLRPVSGQKKYKVKDAENILNEPITGCSCVKILKQMFRLIVAKKDKVSNFFSGLDTDGDGTLDKHELTLCIKEKFEIIVSPEDIDDLFTIIDRDNDGQVTMKELSKAVKVAEQGVYDSFETSHDILAHLEEKDRNKTPWKKEAKKAAFV